MYHDKEYTEQDAQRDMDVRERANDKWAREIEYRAETSEETARYAALDAHLTAALAAFEKVA